MLSKRLRQDGHPVLRWCVSNASAKFDDNLNIKPSKSLSTGRIDGLMALVMALDPMEHEESTPPAGVFAEWA